MRKIILATLIIFSFLIFLPSVSGAVTYYVDAATTEGNVVGDGTSEATAWQTITYALTQVSAGVGHVIHVASGEYTASMSGSSESFPITVGSTTEIVSTFTYLATIEELGSATTAINMSTRSTLEGFYLKGDGSSRMIYVNGGGAVIKNNMISAEGYTYGIDTNKLYCPY